jgi:uncharacterized protein (DUF1810 family)
MTTQVYICIPNSEGTFDSQLQCKNDINDAAVLLSQPVEQAVDIASSLQNHINYQNGKKGKHTATWDTAKSEISKGQKTSCWIWYVFPSFDPVRPHSRMKELHLKNLDEVRDYIAVEILRTRLVKITQIATEQLRKGTAAKKLFGSPDDEKFWECITVFFLVSLNWRLLNPPNQALEMLNKVCYDALYALNPKYTFQRRLHPNTVIEVIKLDRTIHDLILNEAAYHQKYIKYKKTLQ